MVLFLSNPYQRILPFAFFNKGLNIFTCCELIACPVHCHCISSTSGVLAFNSDECEGSTRLSSFPVIITTFGMDFDMATSRSGETCIRAAAIWSMWPNSSWGLVIRTRRRNDCIGRVSWSNIEGPWDGYDEPRLEHLCSFVLEGRPRRVLRAISRGIACPLPRALSWLGQ